MQAEQFYHQILGLTDQWQINEVQTKMEALEVHIYLSYKPRHGFFPVTGDQCPVYDYRESRQWRHLDTMQFITYIHCRVPRVKNKSGQVATIDVPWADKSERHTYMFEAAVIQTLLACKNQTKTSELFRTSFDVVNRILHCSVQRGLSRRSIRTDLKQISIDEKSFKRGHQYVSIIYDSEQQAVLNLVQDRTIEATTTLLEQTFTNEQLDRIEVVAMDMWDAYINAISQKMPKAKIAHDKFHLVKYLTDMIDQVRRKEVKSQHLLKNARWAMLKNKQNLTEKQRLHWEEILNTNLETAKAWRARESFKDLYSASVKGTAQLWSLLLKWYYHCLNMQNDIITKVAKTFYRHMPRILNALKTKATNAIAERLNGKIQELKFVGKGYRRFENFKSAILFFNGKLDLYPQQIQ